MTPNAKQLKPEPTRSSWRLPAVLCSAVLTTACAAWSGPSTLPPLIVADRKTPPLPTSARQPKTPPECSPTCSAVASREFDSWLTSPTSAVAPAQSASAPTTR